jgi:hypothetical protein
LEREGREERERGEKEERRESRREGRVGGEKEGGRRGEKEGGEKEGGEREERGREREGGRDYAVRSPRYVRNNHRTFTTMCKHSPQCSHLPLEYHFFRRKLVK